VRRAGDVRELRDGNRDDNDGSHRRPEAAVNSQAIQGWRGRAVDSQGGQGSVTRREKQVFCRPACSMQPLSVFPFWRSDGQVRC
jgi:hypothetical protein